MTHYQFLIHKNAHDQAGQYLTQLQQGQHPGQYLQGAIGNQNLRVWTVDRFLEALINTKKPQIFAESAVCGDGSDWTLEELSILGDIGCAVPVTIYDNGKHTHPDIYEQPIQGTLLFIPGALLRNGRHHTPADWDAVVRDGEIDFDAYYKLYEKRLLPLLGYADQTAKQKNRKAFITIPGLGCGQFAGPFVGRLGQYLNRALQRLLETHAQKFPNIRALYFDPYNECDNARNHIQGIDYFVRPLAKGNGDKPQLCSPIVYEEDGDDFSDCDLFSVVAWDHVSWPGNDFYVGSRATDDGVKAAATNALSVITGVRGQYDSQKFCYLPPSEHSIWEAVVRNNHIQMKLNREILIF